MTTKVLVMLDAHGRMRGKSHAPECAHAQTWGVQGHGQGYGPRPYKLVEATSVPDTIGRCRFCGGGR